MTITVVAMLVISEVEIDQAASAAGLTLSFVDQLADDDPAGDLAGDDHGEARRDQADAAEEHGHPAFVAGEVDRDPEGDEGEQREDDRQALDRDGDVLRGLQLVRAQDRDFGPRPAGSFSASDAPIPTWPARLVTRLPSLSLTFAFVGRDGFLLVFEHRDQLFVGGPVGVLPEALRRATFRAAFRRRRRRPERSPPETGPGELLGFAGQDFLRFPFRR